MCRIPLMDLLHDRLPLYPSLSSPMPQQPAMQPAGLARAMRAHACRLEYDEGMMRKRLRVVAQPPCTFFAHVGLPNMPAR